MGVLACNRNECDNIMCDTYIKDVGYICHDCVKEFKVKTNLAEATTNAIKAELIKFMHTPKQSGWDNIDVINVDEFFLINNLQNK